MRHPTVIKNKKRPLFPHPDTLQAFCSVCTLEVRSETSPFTHNAVVLRSFSFCVSTGDTLAGSEDPGDGDGETATGHDDDISANNIGAKTLLRENDRFGCHLSTSDSLPFSCDRVKKTTDRRCRRIVYTLVCIG